MPQILDPAQLIALDAWWRAANYLSVGQIYLRDNPLLERPLRFADIKPRLLGHWGTSPGLSFVYSHLNRAIRQRDLDAIYVTGPGHGGPAIVASTYLEGTYSELFPDVTADGAGLKKLFTQFSYPGGIPSHAAPQTPGSINEGGELGYSLAHAFGAAFDNPQLLVACVVGDGEAETGALATSWHSNKFLNPVRDGAVLPILHLNGYKIAGPTVLARIGNDELDALFRGYGYRPHFVEGDDPLPMHERMARALDAILDDIANIQAEARRQGFTTRPRWPMLILRTPKGWTGPREVDGKPVEGTFRAHQVPIAGCATNAAHLAQLEAWMRSYRPQELFDANGTLVPALRALAPEGARRMSANPHANGGALLRELVLPDFRTHAIAVDPPGAIDAETTRVQGRFLRDVMAANASAANFRVFSPDETASNRWDALFEVTNRCSTATVTPGDENVAPDGRVMEMLSEHQCQGWLEGYLLTGRHGLFSCYEAFVHVVDSMFNQHAKWLESARGVPWRRPIASLNIMLTSHVWRQDHNGFSHQDPGFLDVVCNKKPDVIRVYLPPDANTLLAITDLCLRSRDCVNVVVAGKHDAPQWLDIDAAIAHCAAGVSVWEWAGTGRTGRDGTGDPDVVMASAGDVPTMETLAAVSMARERFPEISIRVVNVVDLMRLYPDTVHPHGLDDAAFDALFTRDKPVVFNFHGYPSLIHKLVYRRTNHDNIHVRGYIEEGTTTTPFDMAVLNRIDRFHLVADIVRYVPALKPATEKTNAWLAAKLDAHTRWIRAEGVDLPEVREWRWTPASANR